MLPLPVSGAVRSRLKADALRCQLEHVTVRLWLLRSKESPPPAPQGHRDNLNGTLQPLCAAPHTSSALI